MPMKPKTSRRPSQSSSCDMAPEATHASCASRVVKSKPGMWKKSVKTKPTCTWTGELSTAPLGAGDVNDYPGDVLRSKCQGGRPRRTVASMATRQCFSSASRSQSCR